MALYNKDLTRLSDDDEKAFRDQWAIDGYDKARIRTVGGKDTILSTAEIIEIEGEWLENVRARTPQELDDALEEEVQKELNLSPKIKVLLKQVFILRKPNEPSLTQADFFAELKEDYKNFKAIAASD